MRPEPIFTPPPRDEMDGRVARVRARMEEERLDDYVAFSPDNVFYLTHFANFVHERPFVLVIPRSGPLRFVVPKLEVPHVRTRSIGALEVVPYDEFPAPPSRGWAERLRPLFAAGARVGVESGCPVRIHAAIPGERVTTDIIDDVRMVKSRYEIGRIAYAGEVVTEAHDRLLADARPGTPLMQVAAQLSGMMMQRIARDDPSLNLLATRLTAVFQPPGVSHDPHNFTDLHRVMEEGGPHVSVVNCVVNGYAAEVERTFFLGRVPEKARRPFEVMMEARRAAFELTVPGAVMGEVDRRVRDIFERAGYGDALLHRTGHGIGVTGHEGPFLADGYERMIEPGMVFTIEPGIYLPGIGGFRHSDTVLTTKGGNVPLTAGPVDLTDVTLPIGGRAA